MIKIHTHKFLRAKLEVISEISSFLLYLTQFASGRAAVNISLSALPIVTASLGILLARTNFTRGLGKGIYITNL